ncbi:MAG: stage V sporulation protein AD [Bacilli bacterium]
MTIKYKNVYIDDTYTICGNYENDGPLSKYFDKKYKKDLYFGEKSWEKAEVHLIKEANKNILNKNKLKEEDIDFLISGDLQNQIAASDYMARDFNIPFIGAYEACSTVGEIIGIGSTFIEGGFAKKVLVSTSSHNMVSEKQFRNPTEYGTPKPKTATFTSTGAVSVLLSNLKSKIKVESVTFGKVIDMGITDVNHMGAIMAPGAGEVIYNHLKDTKRDISYYDLILTGDLGIYGKNILRDYMMTKYNIDLGDNYNDCGTMLYDLDNQPVLAGGSGPACSSLVAFGYIYKEMLKGKYKRVLIVPTGALFSPTFTFQKESIPSIANAISLEAIL